MNERIKDAVDEISIVDTHEHTTDRLSLDLSLKKSEWDLFLLFKDTYVKDDFRSAGMVFSDHVIKETNPEKNWLYFKDYLPKVRNTSYYRNLMSGVRELFGLDFDELNENNWREVSGRITEVSGRTGWDRYVLKERANIELALLDRAWKVTNLTDFSMDRECFVPLLRIDPFLCGWDIDHVYDFYYYSVRDIAESLNTTIEDFDDYLGFVDMAIRNSIDKGAVCMKLGVAYYRPLVFEEVDEEEAARTFNRSDVNDAEAKRFEDFMMRFFVEKSIEYELPIQIHTGIQAGGQNILSNSNPLNLNPLFMDYPDAKFILFHGGYPFIFEAGTLAKMFPNVYIDSCWLALISTEAMKRSLSEWLDLVPANKIMWGGDTINVIEAFAHAKLIRKLVSEVLSDKVAKGDFKVDDALDIARMLLRENAIEIFRLKV